jgi:hypothetical protein
MVCCGVVCALLTEAQQYLAMCFPLSSHMLDGYIYKQVGALGGVHYNYEVLVWYFIHFFDSDSKGNSLVNPYAIGISACAFTALVLLPAVKRRWSPTVAKTSIQRFLKVFADLFVQPYSVNIILQSSLFCMPYACNLTNSRPLIFF